MKINRFILFGIIFCISLTSCSKVNYKNVDYNKLFELKLYTDKQTYKTTDKIKIWATLRYVGNKKQIKIWHSKPYISFSITDGKEFEIRSISDCILYSTILIKDQLYEFSYKKSGAFSKDDPKAEYWKKFFEEKDLFLPSGEYTISVSGAFSLSQDDNSINNLKKEIKIKVND